MISAAAPQRPAIAGGADLLVAGIGEMVLTDDPSIGLVAYGLGSCVGLAAWDPRTRVAGLAHFMLPSGAGGSSPVKFVESGLPAFIRAFEGRGGRTRGAHLKAAGGASMLLATAGALEIGRRNAEALEHGLAAIGLRLSATDFGGTSGRTVQLDATTGRLHVRSVSRSHEL